MDSFENLEKSFYDKLKSHGKSLNTLKNYKTDLNCFQHFLKNKKTHFNLDDFNITYIKEYGNYLDLRYKAHNSRRRRVQSLRLFFDFLVEQNILKSNPVRAIPTSPKFLDIPRPTPFDNIKALWNFLLSNEKKENDENNPLPNRLQELISLRGQILVLLIYGAGLKVSDLSKLTSSQIFINSDTCRVLISPPKREPYSVPLPNFIGPLFKKYLDKLNAQKAIDHVEFPHLFFNANPYKIIKGGISPRGIELIFNDWSNALKFPMTPKSLRQAAIYRFIQEGVSLSLIKEWLGVAPAYDIKMYLENPVPSKYDLETLLEMLHSMLHKY